jgi:hypothetical protein
MRLDPRRWLATLRARRRAVLCILLPAFAVSAASAPACAAMARAQREPASVHEHGDAHAAHHGSAHRTTQTHPLSPACPHCPLGSGDANDGHASCAIADAQSTDTTSAKSAPWKAPQPIMDLRLPAASAAPPLIATALKQAEPFTVAIPPTLRHRVLLI